MPRTDELRTYPSPETALLVIMDGAPIALTDNADLVGYDTGGGHDVRLGLTRAGLSYRFELDLRIGQLKQSPMAFSVIDWDDDLARMFGAVDDTKQQLGDVPWGGGSAVAPNSSLAARTDLFDMNIGVERIGPAGERRQYPAPPDATIGWDHSIALDGTGLAGAPVSENPIVWNGRRIELYRVYRDRVTYPHTTGTATWRPMSEARLLWWGTMRDAGRVVSRRWTHECDGPESLFRKPLALGWQRTPVIAVGDITLVTTGSERETGVGITLDIPGGGVGFDTYHLNEFTTDITATSYDGIRDEIRALIDLAAADASLDGPFEDVPGCHVSMDASSAVSIVTTTIAYAPAVLRLCLHRKVWAALGYDVDVQQNLDADDAMKVEFFSMDRPNAGTFAASVPGGDYWRGAFSTGQDRFDPHNGGATRVFEPLYSSGTHILRADLSGGGQVIQLGDATLGDDTSQSTVAHPGQLARPVASLPGDPEAPVEIDGVACNRSGFWVFFGKRRSAETTSMMSSEDVIDEVWVGEASWVDARGLVSGDKIIVTRWWPPERFGYSSKYGITSDWVARQATVDSDDGYIQALPIAVLGYTPLAGDGESGGFDAAHVVLQRLLHTTGTSTGWSSYADDPAAVLDAGGNEPAGGHAIRRDGEVADLGLAIPEARIASPSAFAAVADTVELSSTLDVKYAFAGGYQAADVIRSLMQPFGWCWHLRGGQYGIWCPADSLTLADATLVLDRSALATEYDDEGDLSQELREFQPIDRWRFDYSLRPHDAKTSKLERLSPDEGFRYRPGDVEIAVMAHGHRNPPGDYQRLRVLSEWWARRHFAVKGYDLDLITAEDVWPGTIARLTDPRLVTPDGTYGVTNRLAIVTSVRVRLDVDGGSASCDLLVLDDRTSTPKLNAPVAMARGYDSATQRLYLYPNGFGIEGFTNDAGQWVEPTYAGIAQFGGNATVEVWQFDGSTLAQTFGGTVSGAGADYITLTARTGTYYRDMDSIVVLSNSREANGAWVTTNFAPICNDAGQYTDDASVVQDGFNWEP